MKIEFFESDWGTQFELKPETIDEVSMLARIAKSSLGEKPDLDFNFSGSPYLTVWIKKIKKVAQHNSIKNHK